MTQTAYIDPDGFVYDAVLVDPHPDDPSVITESDIHPSEWDD